MKRPILTIALLASRNREQVVRCLDSLRPIQDALDTELVIVDTSENEEMHKLLLTYTDKVSCFTWCNDFAKARNESIKMAKGEWYLYIDDDEWVEDAKEVIDFFQSGKYKKYGCANYIQRNYHDPSYTIYSDNWASRMIRMGKDTHFESCIHEYLTPQEGEGINLRLIVGHSGYIFQTEEDKRKHFERNTPLLHEMMKREPKNLRWRVQLLQEYEGVHEWKDLIAAARQGLKDFPEKGNTEFNRDIGSFYGAIAEGLFYLGKYQDALKEIMKAMQDQRLQETCIAYLWYTMALCFYELGNYDKVPECVNAYFDMEHKLEGNQIRKENQEGALITGDAFCDMSHKKMYATLIAAGLHFHTTEALDLYFPQLEWNKSVIYCPDGFLEALIYGASHIKEPEKFVDAFACLWLNPSLHPLLYQEIAALANSDAQGFSQAVGVLSLTEKAMTQMPFEDFMKAMNSYLKRSDLKGILLLEEQASDSAVRDSFHFSYLLMRIGELRMMTLPTSKDYATKRQLLEKFASRTCSFYRRFYKEITSNHPQDLPNFAKAAFFIEHGLAVEGNQAEALEEYAEAEEIFALYKEALENYIASYKVNSFDASYQAAKEKRKLSRQILDQVAEFAKENKVREALQILNQYHSMQEVNLESQALKLSLMCQSVEQEEEIVLSIGLMVSNRKDTIKLCIDSLRPIRDAISCQLIVLDTGCDADLRAYLEQEADLVQSFTWCKDFSKARNETLKYAKGQWYMYIDDDEWFVDPEELIQFFTSGEYKDYGYASYIQRNYLDMQGHQYSDAWVGRMAKRVPDLHFESKIHEYMSPLSGNCKGLRSHVDHYGYVFETEEALQAHTQRNVSLLKEMVAEEPDNIRWRVQLIQEYRKCSDADQLLEESQRCIGLFAKEKDVNLLPHICAFYAGVILAKKEQGDYEGEMLACKQALEDSRCLELMKAFCSLHLAESCYFLGRLLEKHLHEMEKHMEIPEEEWQTVIHLYQDAIVQVGEYLQWKTFFEENEPLRFLQAGTAFVGECFDEVMVKEAYSIRISAAILQGDTSYLKEDFFKLEWEADYVYVFEDIVEPLLEAFAMLEPEEIFTQVLTVMHGHKGLWAYTLDLLQELENRGEDMTQIDKISEKIKKY